MLYDIVFGLSWCSLSTPASTCLWVQWKCILHKPLLKVLTTFNNYWWAHTFERTKNSETSHKNSRHLTGFRVLSCGITSKAEVHVCRGSHDCHYPHPPCTIEIPSVESEWVVIGGVGRGIHHHWCVCIEQCRASVCVHVGVLWGAHSYNFFFSLFSAHLCYWSEISY